MGFLARDHIGVLCSHGLPSLRRLLEDEHKDGLSVARDAAIRRGCALGEPGACVVKVAKPGQDPRFDVPAVGPSTVRALVEGRAAVLAVEAEHTVVLERERMVREADEAGLALVGVSEASLDVGAAA